MASRAEGATLPAATAAGGFASGNFGHMGGFGGGHIGASAAATVAAAVAGGGPLTKRPSLGFSFGGSRAARSFFRPTAGRELAANKRR